MPGPETSNIQQLTEQTPSADESDLMVLREAPNSLDLAASYNGINTRAAMNSVRNAETEHFETVVFRLFGGERAAVDAKQLSEELLPSYQGRVRDITAYSTTQLGIDIIVHRGAGSSMHRMPAVAGEAAEALHIAHVPAALGSPVRNHYFFYAPEAMCFLGTLLQRSRLPSQPSDDLFVMLSFLTLKDQVALIQACKSLHKDLGRKVRVNRLLSLVAQGRQDEAEAMIKQDPTLLLERGDITDGAGRNFKNITPLQYAVWALDAHMWTMMLPLFPEAELNNEFSVEAAHQLQALEEKGLGEHGSHFEFKPLLYAYAAFVANPSVDAWCRGVGKAQCLLPAHVIQEYMTPDRPFDPVPDFSVQRGRPGVHGKFGVKWWWTRRYEGGAMGATWAVERGVFTNWSLTSGQYGVGEAGSDERALRALCLQRREDLRDLLDRFDIVPALDIDPPQAPECKSPGR